MGIPGLAAVAIGMIVNENVTAVVILGTFDESVIEAGDNLSDGILSLPLMFNRHS